MGKIDLKICSCGADCNDLILLDSNKKDDTKENLLEVVENNDLLEIETGVPSSAKTKVRPKRDITKLDVIKFEEYKEFNEDLINNKINIVNRDISDLKNKDDILSEAITKKANITDLDSKADKSELDKKADKTQKNYLRFVYYVDLKEFYYEKTVGDTFLRAELTETTSIRMPRAECMVELVSASSADEVVYYESPIIIDFSRIENGMSVACFFKILTVILELTVVEEDDEVILIPFFNPEVAKWKQQKNI